MMWFRGTLRSTNARTLASRSIIYSLRLLQVRHEKAVRHSLLKVPDHRRLPCRDRDCQRLAPSRSELDDIGPVALRAKDHDPVVASHYRRLVLCQFSFASRFTAGASEFFILSQSGERPERYIESFRFDTMPSRPSLQAWAKTVGPSPSMCSLNRMPEPALASTLTSAALRTSSGSRRMSSPFNSIRSKAYRNTLSLAR